MASALLSFLLLLLFLSTQTLAQTPSAPSPAAAGPPNITGILAKNGQYNTFIHFLTVETQVANQIDNQLNSSTDGLTVFAPTDNAFNNLKAGLLNNLNTQQKVQLVLYHVLPKYYTSADLLTISNPVRTQASGQDGGVFGLNFTGQGNQVNVSTGMVETQVNNALRQESPLAVYQVDKVLLPLELFGAKPPTSAPPPAKTPPASSGSNSTNTTDAAEPPGSDASGRNVGLGLVVGLGLICMGVFS